MRPAVIMSPLSGDYGPLNQRQLQTVDLPQLRKKPSYEKILNSLKNLELRPALWDGKQTPGSEIDGKVTSQYLLSIVSSDLAWLGNESTEGNVVENRKDELWELASRRLAERCGRSALPEIVRTWTVPASDTLRELNFEIREPGLTGDNLGLKTWGTAFAMVKLLEELGQRYFYHLLKKYGPTNKIPNSERSRMRVLELGSGTGLVGLAAGAIWGAEVLLTDLTEIKENLLFNIQKNIVTVKSGGGKVIGEVLDWKNPNGLEDYPSTEFEIVIAADSLYDKEHPRLVSQNIKRYLKPHPDSRALVAIPMRDNHTKAMAAEFGQLLQSEGLELSHDGEEICHDDWAEADGEEAVKCWWSVWKLVSMP